MENGICATGTVESLRLRLTGSSASARAKHEQMNLFLIEHVSFGRVVSTTTLRECLVF
jgi:hypothetical protein